MVFVGDKKTIKGTIKNGQPRDTGNIGRKKKANKNQQKQ
jgi:hypothetical protein